MLFARMAIPWALHGSDKVSQVCPSPPPPGLLAGFLPLPPECEELRASVHSSGTGVLVFYWLRASHQAILLLGLPQTYLQLMPMVHIKTHTAKFYILVSRPQTHINTRTWTQQSHTAMTLSLLVIPEYLENNVAGTIMTNYPLLSGAWGGNRMVHQNGKYQRIILHSFLVLET